MYVEITQTKKMDILLSYIELLIKKQIHVLSELKGAVKRENTFNIIIGNSSWRNDV